MSRVLSFEVFEAREFIAQGDKVVVNVFERPRVKATGKVFDNDYVHIYTVREGLIADRGGENLRRHSDSAGRAMAGLTADLKPGHDAFCCLPYPSCTNAVFGFHLKRARSLAISKVQNRVRIGHSRLREQPRSP
jgi:hypothetical protein